MVLIVVFVHTVATNEMQVRITRLQFLSNRGHMACVIVVVNRVCLLLANDAALYEIPLPRETDLNQLAPGEFN